MHRGGRHLDAAVVDVVEYGVVDEVCDKALHEARITRRWGRRQRQADLETAILRLLAPGTDDFPRQGGEVEGLPPPKAGLTPCQGEKRVDEALLAGLRDEELLADLTQ